MNEARAHYRDVLRFVRRRVTSREAAEDLTQDVFVNAAESLARSASAAPPTVGWLYTVARRRIIDEARRRQLTTVPIDSVPDLEASSGAEYASDVKHALEAAVSALPEQQRRVVLLRLLAGRSFSEISRDVGATEDACRMRFMRGLQHLRSDFEKGGLRP